MPLEGTLTCLWTLLSSSGALSQPLPRPVLHSPTSIAPRLEFPHHMLYNRRVKPEPQTIVLTWVLLSTAWCTRCTPGHSYKCKIDVTNSGEMHDTHRLHILAQLKVKSVFRGSTQPIFSKLAKIKHTINNICNIHKREQVKYIYMGGL